MRLVLEPRARLFNGMWGIMENNCGKCISAGTVKCPDADTAARIIAESMFGEISFENMLMRKVAAAHLLAKVPEVILINAAVSSMIVRHVPEQKCLALNLLAHLLLIAGSHDQAIKNLQRQANDTLGYDPENAFLATRLFDVMFFPVLLSLDDRESQRAFIWEFGRQGVAALKAMRLEYAGIRGSLPAQASRGA